jgi:hypothetical protein
MRYSKEHKQETHARIVKKASVRLREKGAHGIGVADLMKEGRPDPWRLLRAFRFPRGAGDRGVWLCDGSCGRALAQDRR